MSSRLVNNKLEVFNPANNKIIETINITSKSQFEATMNKAALSAKKYNYSSVHERKIIISNFRKGIVKYLDDFIDVISNETGKKPLEAMMEVFIVLEFIRQSSKYVHRALDKKKCRVGLLKTRKAWIEYEAMGVVGIISPWNYPLILTASPLVEALFLPLRPS